MPLSTPLKSIYPGPVQLTLFASKPTLWGKTTRTMFTDGSMLIDVQLGTRSGFSPAIAAHEFHHAASYIMGRPDWREWACEWKCDYQREESHAALIEGFMRSSMTFVTQNKIRVSNPPRNYSGIIV